MARLTDIEISGYRSIGEDLHIRVPIGKPLVLIGENNAGKSNIVGAIDLLLGERWPGNWTPEDHDFYERNTEGRISIAAYVDGVLHKGRPISRFQLTSGGSYRTALNVHYDDGGYEFPNSDTRQQLPCFVINADRRLSYQLSYTSKWTLLSKLMQRFHEALKSDEGRREELKANFEQLHQIFEAVPEYAEFARLLVETVGKLGQGMSYGLDVDFSAYDPSNFFRALRVMPSLNGEPRSFDELGTGQEQVLALGFAYAYAAAFSGSDEGMVLVIEEPEAHLHPLAQDWLANQLHRFSSEGVQVIITTHSPAFIDLRSLDGLAVVRKGDSGTQVTQHTAATLTSHCVQRGARASSEVSVLDHYDVSATTELRAGLFAKAVVLVEGPTESFALPTLLRHLGVDLTQLGIACIPVGGKGNLAKWWRLFDAYELPAYVIFDNDKGDDRNGQKRCDVLSTLGVNEGDQDRYISSETLIVEQNFAVMGGDFERCIRTLVPLYAHHEQTCAEIFGTIGKPFTARWIAEQLQPHEVSRLQPLADAVGSLVADSSK